MLTETILGISFSVISRSSLNADLSLAAGKMRKNLLDRRLPGMILQDHRRLPVSIFSGQNRRFRVFEWGFWKDFQI
jgi:hypothetical protein